MPSSTFCQPGGVGGEDRVVTPAILFAKCDCFSKPKKLYKLGGVFGIQNRFCTIASSTSGTGGSKCERSADPHRGDDGGVAAYGCTMGLIRFAQHLGAHVHTAANHRLVGEQNERADGWTSEPVGWSIDSMSARQHDSMAA